MCQGRPKTPCLAARPIWMAAAAMLQCTTISRSIAIGRGLIYNSWWFLVMSSNERIEANWSVRQKNGVDVENENDRSRSLWRRVCLWSKGSVSQTSSKPSWVFQRAVRRPPNLLVVWPHSVAEPFCERAFSSSWLAAHQIGSGWWFAPSGVVPFAPWYRSRCVECSNARR